MDDVRKCRICGCTWDNACMTEEGPCHWVETDLCSACADKEPEAGIMVEGGAAEETEAQAEPEAKTGNVVEMPQRFSELAVAKIDQELTDFRGDNKATAVSKFVASTLTHFCEESERFAEVVYKTSRTLSECCAEIMSGVGTHVSDIDVYRGAVRHYFPNADINFKMEILVDGEAPDEEYLTRPPEKKVPDRKAKPAKADKPAPAAAAAQAAKKDPPAKKRQAPKPEKKQELIQLSLF